MWNIQNLKDIGRVQVKAHIINGFKIISIISNINAQIVLENVCFVVKIILKCLTFLVFTFT